MDPCLNGGVCHNTTRGRVCVCPEYFTGDSCETGNGTSTLDLSIFYIFGRSNPSLIFLILDVRICQAGLCVNGECYEADDDYYCLCAAGYRGENCTEGMSL